MSKKHGHTWWHNKLDPLFREMLSEHWSVCVYCNRYSSNLQVSHVYPKGAYQCLRYDPMNVIPLDGQCHKFFWHENPIDAYKWFEARFPNRFAYLQEAKKISFIRNEEYYLKVEKAIKDRDIKSLLIFHLDS